MAWWDRQGSCVPDYYRKLDSWGQMLYPTRWNDFCHLFVRREKNTFNRFIAARQLSTFYLLQLVNYICNSHWMWSYMVNNNTVSPRLPNFCVGQRGVLKGVWQKIITPEFFRPWMMTRTSDIHPEMWQYFWSTVSIRRGHFRSFNLVLHTIMAFIPWDREPTWEFNQRLSMSNPTAHAGTGKGTFEDPLSHCEVNSDQNYIYHPASIKSPFWLVSTVAIGVPNE